MQVTLNENAVDAAREITRICKALDIESAYHYDRGDKSCLMEIDCPQDFEDTMWAIIERVISLHKE